MAMTRRDISVALASLLLLTSCDDTFNPVEKFEPAMVVYGVLDPSSDTQYVRLAMSYDPPDHIPANQTVDSAVAGAVVQITGAFGTIILQPTVITRWPNDRYTTPIPAFVAAGFRPVRGETYALSISSPLGDAWGMTSIPTSSYVYTPDGQVLQGPQSYVRSREISFNSLLSPLSHAFFFRLFVDYEVVVPGGWEQRTVEIPKILLREDSLDSYIGTYPQLQKRTTQPSSTTVERGVFFAGPYFRMIQLLRQPYANNIGGIRFLRARAVLYQTDEAFYRYVKTVNGFNDQFSIRTDEPDVTNIVNGRGLFSSIGTDTLTVLLPSSLGL